MSNDCASLRLLRFTKFFEDCEELAQVPVIERTGMLTRASGLVLEASGLSLAQGCACTVEAVEGVVRQAEVVGFSDNRLYLMPSDSMVGVTLGAKVKAHILPVKAPQVGVPSMPNRRGMDHGLHVPVGEALLGRVVDGAGRALDGMPLPSNLTLRPLYSRPLNPLQRAPIRYTLDVGVRAINGLLTIGRGQRLGLFSGSGVGKSMLLGMMARHSQADVTVVGLIGERGREVRDFLSQRLSDLSTTVVVVATADSSPLMRLHGAAYATALAEHFRDQGKQVLLIMDSLTRYAMAQREIALAIGEPPVTRGYPPSVFARLPQLVERSGNGNEEKGEGSITALYTVLTEADDPQDPIADAARAVLDGHITLSRTLADQGHYPAIDLEHSISRAMESLVTPAHAELARRLRALVARYSAHQDLLAIGAYAPGQDFLLDEAVKRHAAITNFLQQELKVPVAFDESVNQLRGLFADLHTINS